MSSHKIPEDKLGRSASRHGVEPQGVWSGRTTWPCSFCDKTIVVVLDEDGGFIDYCPPCYEEIQERVKNARSIADGVRRQAMRAALEEGKSGDRKVWNERGRGKGNTKYTPTVHSVRKGQAKKMLYPNDTTRTDQ